MEQFLVCFELLGGLVVLSLHSLHDSFTLHSLILTHELSGHAEGTRAERITLNSCCKSPVFDMAWYATHTLSFFCRQYKQAAAT